MKTKFLFALLIIALGITLCPAPPPVYPPGRGGGGGTGGVYSNDTRTAVITTFYTNDTPHYIDGIARLGYSGAGTLTVSVTNSDNTRFFPFVYDALSVGATSNSLPFKVPPGGWWKFSGTGSTATDGTQVLTYNATNGAVTYATTAGSVPGGVTEAGLAAGSYDIRTVIYGTNAFFGSDSALLSRGLYIRSAAWEYIPGLGSVDLQSPADGSATNRLSKLDAQFSTIAGGLGNSLSNSLLDQSFNYNFIAGGLNNKMINGDASSILGGVGNYLGPLSDFGAGGEVQSSVIAGGHDNAIFDGHEAFIGCGVGNTNHAAQGFVGAGNRNLIDFSGNSPFIGAGNDNTITNAALAFIGAGQYNRIVSALGAATLGSSNYVTMSNSVTLGVFLTNANYAMMAGIGTNFFGVSPNGGVTYRGSGGETNLLRFTSTTLSLSIDTPYTNTTRRAFIQIRAQLSSVGVGGDLADVRLEIDQDHNGGYEETENRFVEADPGTALATEVVLSDYLLPDARFRVVSTNSTGFGGATILATRVKYL